MKQLRVVGLVLVSPLEGLRILLERPKAAVAVLLIMAACLAAHAFIHARIDVAAQQRLTAAELTGGKPGGDVSDEEVVETAQQALNLRRLGGYGLYLIGIPLLLVLLSLLAWLGLGAWRPGQGFRRCYRLVAHAALPLGVRQLCALAVIASYPSIDPQATQGLFKTSLADWLGPGAPAPLHVVDPFVLWAAVLMVLVGRVLGRGWVRSISVGIVFAGLFAALSQML